MDRHQRIQQKKVDAPPERLHSRSIQSSSLQTRSFGVQKRSTAAAPASKAELWDNYQSTKQLSQNGARSLPIQAKLSIGQPGDKYEQEADSVADRVMSMSEPTQVQREAMPEEEELQMKPLAETISPLVQREAMPEEEELQMKPEANPIQREAMPEEEELQMKSVDNSIQREAMPEEEEMQMKPEANPIQREAMPEEEELQMKQSPATNTPVPTSSLENQLSSSKGGGNPLADDVRSFMEPRFGADFSGVRVHTGSDAVQMNRDVNAQAFAHGSDIYFGAGKAPGNNALTAHELTHVVQQTGSISTSLLRPFRDSTNDSVQRAVPIAGLALSAATFAIDARDGGQDAFSNKNVEFRYTRDKSGPKKPVETEQDIFHMFSLHGFGDSRAGIKLFLKYDGHNIISAYTQAYRVVGYDGGIFGSEGAVNFSAIQSSEPTQDVTEAHLLFHGFNNPSGPGFQRFNGRILVRGDGKVIPKECNLVGGDGDVSTEPVCTSDC